MNISRWMSFSALAVLLTAGSPAASAQPDGGRDVFDPPAAEGPHRGAHDEAGHRGSPDDQGEPPPFDESSGDDRGRRGPRMTDAEIDAAYQIVVRLYPELADRLAELRRDDAREWRQTLERRFPRVHYLVNLQQRDPEMFELRLADIQLDRLTRALAEQLREARDHDDKDGYKQLRDQLETKVAEHFDVRQKIRGREIEALRQKLEELEERLDDRDDDRKDLIELRVEELAGVDW